ncbi:hypothetical protein [Bacteroides clarus]|uniref:hypothetical protein n=1 Tax=Bacteroides clarus TaxID=626929 RepID=UPI00248E36E9|nr:hypothetical protein [Bacteroides clarus]
MVKGIIVLDNIPECCVTPDGRVKCPFAWNTQFCSRFSPKGLDMTNGDWEKIYTQGIRPDFCPIKPIPERKMCSKSICIVEDEYNQRKGWNACLNEIEGKM